MICPKCNTPKRKGKYCDCCGYPLDGSILFNPVTITLTEIYEKWKFLHFRRVSANSVDSYITAYKKLIPLHDEPFCKIRAIDIQTILDGLNSNKAMSMSTNKRIIDLYSQLCQYAMMEDIINVNYAKFLINNGYTPKETDVFLDDEIVALFDYANKKENIHCETARITLCLIFLGYRPNEFFNITSNNISIHDRYIISGSKTIAGQDRMIPIADCIFPYIREWYIHHILPNKDVSFLVQSEKGMRITLNNWRRRNFYPLMEELEINNSNRHLTPYSARHTFATLCCRSGVADNIRTDFMGHVDANFTHKVYTHLHLPDYRIEIAKIDTLINKSAT